MARRSSTRSDSGNAAPMLQALVSEAQNSDQLLELYYYWSSEPDLLPIVRGLLRLHPAAREIVVGFLATQAPLSVIATKEPGGGVRLVPGRNTAALTAARGRPDAPAIATKKAG